MNTPRPYQGGFSDSVYNATLFQDYIAGAEKNVAKFGSPLVFGYIGARNRTAERDRIVETSLPRRKSPERIAAWLISSDARMIMDWIPNGASPELFAKLLGQWTSGKNRR